MSDDIKANVADATKNVSDDTKQEAKKYDEEYVNTVKAESVKRGKQLKEAETKLAALEAEKLTDIEKKDKRIKELEIENESIRGNIKTKDIDNLILKATVGKNFVDIDTVTLLIKKELESEEDINEKVIEKIVDKLIKDKPFLITSSTITPGTGMFPKKDSELAKTSDQMFGEFLHGK